MKLGRFFAIMPLWNNTEQTIFFPDMTYLKKNKPERVFGLQVRRRELDFFKILEMFWIFWGIF
jgi:hypothetical protein